MDMLLIETRAATPWRSRKTYRMIEAGLRERWRNVRSIRASTEAELEARLYGDPSGDHAFIFNIGEYLDERRKRGFIPGLLDAWGFPHLGSPADVVLAGLDKGRTKEILVRNGIPTPRYFVTESGDLQIRERAARIGFPLIVKPLREGGHRGVGEDSIVPDAEALERAVARVSLNHRQPSLVEEYIDGDGMREFSVGIIDGGGRVHLPIEVDWNAMHVRTRILSYDAAQRDRERVAPVTDRETIGIVNDLANRTFDALGAADYARIDIRASSAGYFVLEINIMPGLGPKSFLSLAARDLYGFSHGDLIRFIALESIKRQGLAWAS